MAENSLSPGFAKFYYTGPTGIQHVATLPVAPPAGFTNPGFNPTITTKDDDTVSFGTAALAYGQLLAEILEPLSTVQFAEYWSKPTPASDPIYIYTQAINLPGTNALSGDPTYQIMMTTRTDAGGVAKFAVMGCPRLVGAKETDPTANSDLENLYQFLLKPGLPGVSIFTGRDGGWPIAFLGYFGKTNDSLRRKVNDI